MSVKLSEDVASTAGLFFDFSSVNAETIRGKWKSDCCLDVTLTKDFPDHLYRQVFELPVTFVLECFMALPGGTATVPVGTAVHNYRPPSVTLYARHALCFGCVQRFGGKALYTSGRATGLSFRVQIELSFVVKEA